MSDIETIPIQLEGFRRDQNEFHQLILKIREDQIKLGHKVEWTNELLKRDNWLEQWLHALEVKHENWKSKQKIIEAGKERTTNEKLVWNRKK